MAAKTPTREKVAVTVPTALSVHQAMGVVVTSKGYGELLKANALCLLCVSLGLFDLANHPIIHSTLLFSLYIVNVRRPKENTQAGACVF
jgi:hypothetical protein